MNAAGLMGYGYNRYLTISWWRHQMETFPRYRPFAREFTERPVTRNFNVFFDLRLNKGLSKQSWGWWFETLSRPLWHHCNGIYTEPRRGHYSACRCPSSRHRAEVKSFKWGKSSSKFIWLCIVLLTCGWESVNKGIFFNSLTPGRFEWNLR